MGPSLEGGKVSRMMSEVNLIQVAQREEGKERKVVVTAHLRIISPFGTSFLNLAASWLILSDE